jgi:CRISPR system Cascade subunit CasD
MSDTAFLALLLDGPLQAWGLASRFQRRNTKLHPTKSAVIGLLCAAMGLAKGSPEELATLPELAQLRMCSIAIPREAQVARGPHPVLRLEDYHTVLDTRRASGALNKDAVVTHRQYLLDARFGVVLSGNRPLLERAAAALQDPVWGVWFGRKSCIPADPVFRGVFKTRTEAERVLIGEAPIEQFTRLEEVANFDAGTDSYNDQPVSFGNADSSAEGRDYAVRRVNLIVGNIPDA